MCGNTYQSQGESIAVEPFPSGQEGSLHEIPSLRKENSEANSSSDHLVFLEQKVLETDPSPDFIVLLGNWSAHVGNFFASCKGVLGTREHGSKVNDQSVCSGHLVKERSGAVTPEHHLVVT